MNIRNVLSCLINCLTISLKASKIYTFLRMAIKLFIPLNLILISYTTKIIIDTLVENSTKVYLFLFIEFFLLIFNNILQKSLNYITLVHEKLIEQNIDLKVMDLSISASIEIFDNTEYYNKLTSIRIDSNSTSGMLWNALDFFSAILSSIITGYILCKSNLLYGFLIFLTAIPIALVDYKYTRSLYFLDKSQLNDVRKLEYIYNITTNKPHSLNIRFFDLKSFLLSRYENIWEKNFDITKKENKKKSIFTGMIDILPEIIQIGILFDLTKRILQGINTIGDFSFYASMIRQLKTNISMMVSSLSNIYENRLKLDNMLSFFEIQKTEEKNKLEVTEIKSIEFKHVSFIYPGTSNVILNDISFIIHEKDKIAIVGTNGSGKTTLIKLLLHYYEPTEGEILINGLNINKYNTQSLRKCFSTYFQNDPNYAFTIKENISIGNLDIPIDIEKLNEELKNCDVENILSSNEGINAYLTKRYSINGIELSGGENQKIALARAMYRDASIMVFDEPSASLDPEAENKIFQIIEDRYKNKTILFTSHRLSNIFLANYIFLIENGKIIEQGTANELLMDKTRFSQLFDYQATKYKRGNETC